MKGDSTNPNLPLPRSSSTEDLETISLRKLNALFPPNQFEFRHESFRDKGVDVFIEIKENNHYTNYRIAIQLKATNSIKENKDGSISFPLEVSNIGYLDNFTMPSYYVIYDVSKDYFRIEETLTVKAALYVKYTDGALPNTFSYRFSKRLNDDCIQEIYTNALESGSFFKDINNQLGLLKLNKVSSGILIDGNKKISSIYENISLICKYGLQLLNEANFGTIIDIENRAYPRKEVPAIFDLVCGLAYYHKGKLHRSLDLLSAANKRKDEFNQELQSSLMYSILQAKFEAGILSKTAYKDACTKLLSENELGSYLQLEKLYGEIIYAEKDIGNKFEEFCKKTVEIINSESENPKARILGYSRILEVGANFLFDDLAKKLNFYAGKEKGLLREQVFVKWKHYADNFSERINALMKYALEHGDLHSMGNMARLKLEWAYRALITRTFHDNWSYQTLSSSFNVSKDGHENLLYGCRMLDRGSQTHLHVDDQESIVYNLMLQYEILHFLGETTLVNEVIDRAKAIIIEYDFEILNLRFESLLNKGTRHEKLSIQITALLKQIFSFAERENLLSSFFGPVSEDALSEVDTESNWTFINFISFNFPEY